MFAERIQKYLDKKGWFMADLCRAASLSSDTMSELKTGSTKSPRGDILEKIVRNTDINPEFLLTCEGPILKNEVPDPQPMTEREKNIALSAENRILKECLKMKKQEYISPKKEYHIGAKSKA